MPYAAKQYCMSRSVSSHPSKVVPFATQTWRDARIILLDLRKWIFVNYP